MTAIKNLSVNWMHGYANDPTFEIETVESNPETWPKDNLEVWNNYGGIHIAEGFDDLIVPYFYSDGKPTGGFGGRSMRGTFTDGKTFNYKGGWSSRAGVVNKMFVDQTDYADYVVDVTLNKYIARAVWSFWVIDFARNMPNRDFGLVWVVDNGGETILMPTRNGLLKNSYTVVETVL